MTFLRSVPANAKRHAVLQMWHVSKCQKKMSLTKLNSSTDRMDVPCKIEKPVAREQGGDYGPNTTRTYHKRSSID
jgi:hypothetical protein